MLAESCCPYKNADGAGERCRLAQSPVLWLQCCVLKDHILATSWRNLLLSRWQSVLLVEKVTGNVRPEFYKLRTGRALGGHRQRPLDSEAEPAVAGRVIQIGYPARNEIAAHVGIIRSPSSVVPFAPDIRCGGIQRAMQNASLSFAKVARILVQQDGQNGIAPQIAIERIRVRPSVVAKFGTTPRIR